MPTRARQALSKLGGKAWQTMKSRARESVRELAGELIELYAQRQTQEGIAYDLSHEWLPASRRRSRSARRPTRRRRSRR